MGLFDKIKNILFEEDEFDETMSDIPVYKKKEIKEEKIVASEQHDKEPVVQEELTPVIDNSRFRNVKRDIDLSFEDEEEAPKVNVEVQQTRDIMSELKRGAEVQREERRQAQPVFVPREEEKPLPQRRSVFQSFDVEEFERLNSKTNEMENRRREEVQKREQTDKISMSEARLANSNFSSTKPTRKETDPEKYKIDNHQGKKPFRPSPVISPVYGILDKNYTADEIVDKTDGLKREKKDAVVRTPDIESKSVKTEEKTIEDAFNDYDTKETEISIDSVRNKAYGVHNELTQEIEEVIEEPSILEDDFVDDIEEVIEEINEEVVPEEMHEIPKIELPKKDESEEDVRSRFVKDDSYKKETPLLDEEDEEESYVPEEEYEEENDDVDSYEGDSLLDVSEDKVKKSHILDDMEKTSTLQILDDIEKELNSIKNVATADDNDVYTLDERLERNDTLENDLFNLIDSMYDNGEEDEEDND